MNYVQLLTILTLAVGAIGFGCSDSPRGDSGSQLASFAVKATPKLKVGADYDQIQVKSQHRNADKKNYDDWLVTKSWAGLTETNKEASLEDPVKVTVGTYRINTVYLKAGATVASATEDLPECLIKSFDLQAGVNNQVTVDACLGGKQPDDKSRPKDPTKIPADDVQVTITTNIVNSSGSTAGNGSGSNAGNGSGTKALALPSQTVDYPDCPAGTKPSSGTDAWGWAVDEALCATGTASKVQIAQKLGGCSCRIAAAH